MLKKIFYSAGLIISLYISLGLKISSIPNKNEYKSTRDHEPSIEQFLKKSGWKKQNIEYPLNNDALRITHFTHHQCNEDILSTALLYRNSENSSVLRNYFTDKDKKIKFIYLGKSYQKFPSFEFWLGQNFLRLLSTFKKNSSPINNYVLAIIYGSPCSLKRSPNL